LWNLETNECLRTFDGYREVVICLEISFDKTKLYSGSSEGTLREWDISLGKCLKRIDLDHSICCLKLLSRNFLAVGLKETKDNLKIIDLKSYEIVKSLETDSGSVTSLNFDSEKNVLFSGLENGDIKMWQF
jgi:WD40 repeat protein